MDLIFGLVKFVVLAAIVGTILFVIAFCGLYYYMHGHF